MITHSKNTNLSVAIIIFISSLLSGCSSEQVKKMSEAAGAAVGAVTAGVRAGVEGAKVGWKAASNHESKQVRSEQQDRRLYGFSTATNSVLIKLNKGYSTPKTISPGEQVRIHSDYSLSLPKSYNNKTDVTAVWILKKDNEVILKTKPAIKNKKAGGHLIDHPFDIPKTAEPGTYVVETKLSSGSAYDVNEATFVVK